LEASSYPTSYIPTTSSSATRVADACFKTGISLLIGQTEGVYFVDFNYLANSDFERLALYNSVDGARFSIGINTMNGLQFVGFNSSGTVVLNENYAINSRNKCAILYTATNIKVFYNGVLKNTITVSFTKNFNALTNSYIGTFPFFQSINSLILFPTTLTDADCIALTTL